MSQLSGQRATSPSSTSREGAQQRLCYPHATASCCCWRGAGQDLGEGAHGGCAHVTLPLPLQAALQSHQFLGGLGVDREHDVSPPHLWFVLGSAYQGGRGRSCHRAAMQVPMIVIWGPCHLLAILLDSVHVTEFSSFIDFKELPSGQEGPKHAPSTDSHSLPHTLTHVLTHTPAHALTCEYTAPPLPAPPLAPRTAPSAPHPQYPFPLPFQATWHRRKPPGGVTEVVPAYTWLTRVNTPVAICTGGCLSGLLDVLPVRKTMVLKPIRTRSAGRQLARPAGPLAAGSGWGWAWLSTG